MWSAMPLLMRYLRRCSPAIDSAPSGVRHIAGNRPEASLARSLQDAVWAMKNLNLNRHKPMTYLSPKNSDGILGARFRHTMILAQTAPVELSNVPSAQEPFRRPACDVRVCAAQASAIPKLL